MLKQVGMVTNQRHQYTTNIILELDSRCRGREQTEPSLTNLFSQDGVQITCMGWRRLFRLQEHVYVELCVEFFATVHFLKQDGINDLKKLTFCLRGQRMELSLAKLS